MSEFDDLKQWLKDTEEEPLEEMVGFFEVLEEMEGDEATMIQAWK